MPTLPLDIHQITLATPPVFDLESTSVGTPAYTPHSIIDTSLVLGLMYTERERLTARTYFWAYPMTHVYPEKIIT